MKTGNPSRIFDRTFLPVGLVLVLLISLCFPDSRGWTRRLSVFPFDQVLIATVFFISGLRLHISHLFEQKPSPVALLPVAGVQFLMAPLTAWILGAVLPLPTGWFVGLAAICCVPTTLSSGIVLTRQAEGNEILALVLTLVLTLGGTLLTPLWFGWILQSGAEIDLAIIPLILKLFFLVLIPLSCGQLVKIYLVRRPPEFLKHVPSLCVILLVWMAAQSHAEELRALGFWSWLAFPWISFFIHLLWFATIWWIAGFLKVHPRNRSAMAIVGSQKTLPLAVTILTVSFIGSPVAAFLPTAIGFVVIFHLTQILVDSVLANRMAQIDSSHE